MRDETRARPILPVSLLVAGLPCLVVGGGKIAARKVGHLLDAEADVTVISPGISEALAGLVDAGRVRHEVRAVRDDDVKDYRLVFAVTDDEDTNRRVLDACRTHGVLSSAADANWPDGDLIMPAITRREGLVVTVATGGKSCRTARVVKDHLAKALDELAVE
jgi:siroheme synthase-like protein